MISRKWALKSAVRARLWALSPCKAEVLVVLQERILLKSSDSSKQYRSLKPSLLAKRKN